MIKKAIVKAYEYAEQMHSGQVRKFSGLPYFSHPKYVARVIEHLTRDEKLIITAFLHDVIEDTVATYEDIVREFGSEVADLVQELTTSDIAVKKLGKRQVVAQKMFQMSGEALTVKLADRFHNVLFLEGDSVDRGFIAKYYKETRYILDYIKERQFSYVQELLVKRISVILDFLEVRYDL